MKRERLTRAVVATTIMLSGCLTMVGSAAANPDMITYAGCLANTSAEGCVPVTGTSAPLNGPAGVVATSDGRSVYVISDKGNSIAQFVRADPGGQLTYDGCLGNTTVEGCSALPLPAFNAPRVVIASSDGNSVYVISQGRQNAGFVGSVTHLTRDLTTGRLTFGGCWTGNGVLGCTSVPSETLHAATAAALSPDRKSLYIASSDHFRSTGVISLFFRDLATGNLTFGSCIADSATANCPDAVAAEPTSGPTAIAVTSRAVYVTGTVFNNISYFNRNTLTGQLSYISCHAIHNVQGCEDLPGEPIRAPKAVTVSPEGDSVYVAAATSITHFHRHLPNGNLSYIRCHADDGNSVNGCIDLPLRPFNGLGPNSIAVSPNGKSVYATSGVSVVQMDRESSLLFYRDCVGLRVDSVDDCPFVPGFPFLSANGVAVSPDSASVYVSALDGNSVSHFVR